MLSSAPAQLFEARELLFVMVELLSAVLGHIGAGAALPVNGDALREGELLFAALGHVGAGAALRNLGLLFAARGVGGAGVGAHEARSRPCLLHAISTSAASTSPEAVCD